MNRPLFWGILVATITLAATGRIVSHGFGGWDDPDNFTNNRNFNPPTLAGAMEYWSTPTAGLYVPVAYNAWALIAVIARQDDGRLAAWPFHLASVLTHAAAALLVFQLLRLLMRSDPGAAIGALIFGVHPLQIEAVAWTSGLKDVLSGLFALIAVEQYVRFSQTNRHRRTHYAVAFTCFLLAMFSKPAAIVVPLIVGLIDVLIIRTPIKRCAIGLLPWVVVTVPVVIVARLAQETGTQYVPPILLRPLVATDALAFYLVKLVLPFNLSLDYGRSPTQVLLETRSACWTWIIPALAAVVIIFARSRWLLAAGLTFATALAPVLGFTPFQQQFNSTVTDHYMYLAMLGPAIAAAWGASRMLHRPALTGPVAGVAILALASLSFVQAGYWRDDRVLLAHGLAINPRSAPMHNNLGTALAAQGDFPAAMTQFRAALEYVPYDPLAHRNLAYAMISVHDVDGAIPHLRESIRITEEAGEMSTEHLLLAKMLGSRGLFPEAAQHLQIVVKRDPTNSEARRLLGDALARAAGQHPTTNATPASPH